MRKGLFISVDGPNGAGKTTFIRTLVENLSVNYDVYDTREPSPTSFGTFVKKNEGGLKGMQYAQLIWADRHYHLQTCVQPQLMNFFISVDKSSSSLPKIFPKIKSFALYLFSPFAAKTI